MIERQKMTRLEQAILTAVIAHQGQIDEDGQPHIVHSLEVMLAVKKNFENREETVPYINGDEYSLEELMAAGVLHDVPEDTSFTLDDIRRDFGAKIAVAVAGVTRRHGDPLCKLPNCKEHGKETYRDFIYRAAKWPASKFIKLADLGCNLRRVPQIKKASWRKKLEYKYGIALRVLAAEVETSWEDASWEWEATKEEVAALDNYPTMGQVRGRYFVADPNGKRIEITEEQFYDEYKLAKRAQ